MKKIQYLIKSIYLPLLFILICSIVGANIFSITKLTGSFFEADLPAIKFFDHKITKAIIISILLVIALRLINKEKEFAPANSYNDFSTFHYHMAKFCGYRKVNLKLKPQTTQFKLLDLGIFECFDDTEYSSKDFDYDIKYIGKMAKNIHSINIMVGDTYPISLDKLPDYLKNEYTILINRSQEPGTRVISQNLIDIIQREVQNQKNICKTFNLFLNTPAGVNKKIFNDVFKTRDGLVINVYKQDSKNGFKFIDKPFQLKMPK